MRNQRPIILFTLALCTLVGCGSSTASNNPTSNQTAASKSGTSLASPSATAGASQPSRATSASTSTTTGTNSTASPTFANGQPMQLTAEEAAAYRRGEYLPATDKHPALNVPIPVLPEAAKEKTAEGASAFIQYWTDAQNYAVQTGSVDLSRQATSPTWTKYGEYLDAIEKHYQESYWTVGAQSSNKIQQGTFKASTDQTYTINVYPHDFLGKSYNYTGQQTEVIPEQTFANNPIELTLEWKNGAWIIASSSGLAGVDYGH